MTVFTKLELARLLNIGIERIIHGDSLIFKNLSLLIIIIRLTKNINTKTGNYKTLVLTHF